MDIGAAIGLFGGMICGLAGLYFGRRKAQQHRGLDELYEHIWRKTRSHSWYATLVAIYILFALVIFGVKLSAAAVLGILLFVHIGSWGIMGMIFTMNFNVEGSLKPSQIYTMLIAGFGTLITFTIISVLTGNWLFLIVSLAPSLLSIYFGFRALGKPEIEA